MGRPSRTIEADDHRVTVEFNDAGTPVLVLVESETGVTGEMLRELRLNHIRNQHTLSGEPFGHVQLDVPPRRPYPQAFYEDVAAAYKALAFGGARAACKILAEANNKPITTVHRWVRETRKRGLLPPGQPGVVG